MKVWAVLWRDDSGYPMDAQLFSSKDKVYNYIEKVISDNCEFQINEHPEKEYDIQDEYKRLIRALNEVYDHDYTDFFVDDFNENDFFVQLKEIDSPMFER